MQILVGVYRAKGTVYLVMPLEEQSLYDALHERRTILSNTQKEFVIKGLARALAEIHTLGLVHGHLNPFNVMLTRGMRVKIADVGLQRLKKYAGVSLGYVNKSAWTSPERLREPSNVVQRASVKDDVFSFGVLAWEVITGMLPHEGLDLEEIRDRVGRTGMVPLIPESIPHSLSRLLAMCMTQLPDMRPTMDIVCSELVGFNWG